MDPSVLYAVLLLIGTKAAEKTGEKLGEQASQVASRLWNLLSKKKPETVEKITQVAGSLDLPHSDSANLLFGEIISDVHQISNVDGEVEQVIKLAASQWEEQRREFPNSPKLAEKIGILNLAPIFGGQHNTLNF